VIGGWPRTGEAYSYEGSLTGKSGGGSLERVAKKIWQADLMAQRRYGHLQ